MSYVDKGEWVYARLNYFAGWTNIYDGVWEAFQEQAVDNVEPEATYLCNLPAIVHPFDNGTDIKHYLTPLGQETKYESAMFKHRFMQTNEFGKTRYQTHHEQEILLDMFNEPYV